MSYFPACSLLLNNREQEADKSRNLKENRHTQVRGHIWLLKNLLGTQLEEPGSDSDFLLVLAFNFACKSYALLSATD